MRQRAEVCGIEIMLSPINWNLLRRGDLKIMEHEKRTVTLLLISSLLLLAFLFFSLTSISTIAADICGTICMICLFFALGDSHYSKQKIFKFGRYILLAGALYLIVKIVVNLV